MCRIIYLLVFLTVLFNGKSNAADTKPVRITATSWLVADGTGKIIQGENTTQQRSIASITKLITAMVVLDANQDLDEFLKPYTRREMIQLALVKSDNQASLDLCKHYPGGTVQCVKAMNDKAKLLGLTKTQFIESSGLSVMNVSTAEELIKIVMAASKYKEIILAARTSEVKIKLKKKWFVFHNTNPIIGKRHDFVVSKTGFINASGGCIVTMIDTEIGTRIVVVLGSKNTRTRIPEAEFIATMN
jgi:serine-type D-Ala-D-Ala endopeptidase (penicillin-binding protein 7)